MGSRIKASAVSDLKNLSQPLARIFHAGWVYAILRNLIASKTGTHPLGSSQRGHVALRNYRLSEDVDLRTQPRSVRPKVHFVASHWFDL